MGIWRGWRGIEGQEMTHGLYEMDTVIPKMKAFVYSESEIMRVSGFTPDQIERARVRIIPQFEPTSNVDEADFFWFPIDLGHWEAYHGGVRAIWQGAQKLAHWQGNEARHVFYFCSDGADPVDIPSIMFRQSFYTLTKDVNAVAWPYAVDDFGDLVTGDFDSLPYDVSFVGSRVSHKCRMESFDSMKDTPIIKTYLYDSKLHWGKIENTPVGMQWRVLFIESLGGSKMVLAPRGGGLSSYRFFEAMSAGRVPILIADDWELPCKDLIEWDKCMIQIPESEARRAGPFLIKRLKGVGNRDLAEMGLSAYAAWRSYLSPDVWPEMMTWRIERLLR